MPWLAPIGTPLASGRHRQPRADLAVEPRREGARVALTRGKGRGRAARGRACLRVAVGVGLAWADARKCAAGKPSLLRAVISSASARVRASVYISRNGARAALVSRRSRSLISRTVTQTPP